MDGEDDAKSFSMTPNGLFRGRMFVCGPFEVVAQSRIITDGKATDWGLRIRFRNPDGAVIEEPIAARDLYGEPMRLSAELASLGMDINNSAAAKSALASYLGSVKVKDRALITTRTGWTAVQRQAGLRAPSTDHRHGERARRPGRRWPHRRLCTSRNARTSGSSISAILRRSPALTVRDRCAFAATLLQMSGGESGGFHLHEFSSKGKTTVQQVAASVWGSGALNGGFIRRWRATANSLEASFAAASDTCLILDEMSQAGYGEVSAIVYSVTGEVGKGAFARMRPRGRPIAGGRSYFRAGRRRALPGSMRIATRRAAGRDLRGGATVRFIDIPADREFGAFDKPASEPNFNPAAFAERMQELAATYYGVAGPAFVKSLLDEKVSAAVVRQNVNDVIAHMFVDASNDEGQARRVARRFALVAVAGLMAIGAGIVDWDADAFLEGICELFDGWVAARGDGGSIEEAQILSRARLFWARYGESRFDEDEPPRPRPRERPVGERAGYKQDEPDGRRWYVFPQVWGEIFRWRQPKGGNGSRGAWHPGAGLRKGSTDKRVQLGRLKRQNFYVINQKIFEGWDQAETPCRANA